MKITATKIELVNLIMNFSKFVPTSGKSICNKVYMHFRFKDEDSLTSNEKSIQEIADKAVQYKNIFGNQASILADYILSSNDEELIYDINEIIEEYK